MKFPCCPRLFQSRARIDIGSITESKQSLDHGGTVPSMVLAVATSVYFVGGFHAASRDVHCAKSKQQASRIWSVCLIGMA